MEHESDPVRVREPIIQPAIEIEQEPASIQPQPSPQLTRAPVVRSIDEPPSGRALAVERVIVRHSPEIDKLAGALAIAQGAFEDLERTRTARVQSQRANYAYDYETLADVIAATRKALSENGLALMQFPFPSSASLTVRTWLVHSSGQWVYNDLSASIEGTDPRSIGSGITYLSRYARKAILGIAAEYDDDGAAAMQRGQHAPQEPIKPALRKSEQAHGQPQPAPPQPAKLREPNVGKIKALERRGDGALVELETGFVAATKHAETIAALERFKKDDLVVALVTSPSSDPKRFAPNIVEVSVRRG